MAILGESEVPIAQASALAVDIPADNAPKSDCYIDNLIAAFLEHNCTHGMVIIPFAMHLLGHPLADDETLLRDDILLNKKLYWDGLLIPTALQSNSPPTKTLHGQEPFRHCWTPHGPLIRSLINYWVDSITLDLLFPWHAIFLGQLWTAMYAADKRHSVKLLSPQ